ncbi:LAG1 longevity assurance-like protein 3 [Raphanus sativus]|nr:LAG1 longevity assurance-like protein 3 [Raphanus sativus]
MSKYGESIASFSLVLFALSWVVLRLLFGYCGQGKHPVEGPIHYYMFNKLLFCLLVLHIFCALAPSALPYVKQVQDPGKLSVDADQILKAMMMTTRIDCMVWTVSRTEKEGF